jgi:hypothetical protein
MHRITVLLSLRSVLSLCEACRTPRTLGWDYLLEPPRFGAQRAGRRSWTALPHRLYVRSEVGRLSLARRPVRGGHRVVIFDEFRLCVPLFWAYPRSEAMAGLISRISGWPREAVDGALRPAPHWDYGQRPQAPALAVLQDLLVERGLLEDVGDEAQVRRWG